MTSAALPLADVARLREGTYRLLALLLLPPDDRRWRSAAALAADLRAHSDALASFGGYVELRRLLDAIAGREADGAGDVAGHTQLFGIGPDGVACPPYEASYVAAGEAAAAGHIAAQLEHTYRREGLHLAPVLNERPDHASVELEFMAYLCATESAAWDQGSHDDALRLLGRERGFLDLHLAGWIGPFAESVRAATTQPLYAALADALDAVIHHDSDLTAALVAQVERLHRERAQC